MAGISIKVADASFSKTIAGNNILDVYGSAAAAYSLRKIRYDYAGKCIKVRRSSDSTLLDIGFVGASLDVAALATFCGAGSGYVATWYDQSGNARDSSTSTTALQPTIYSSGAVVVESGVDSTPAIDFNNHALDITGFSLTAMSMVAVMNYKNGTGEGLLVGAVATNYWAPYSLSLKHNLTASSVQSMWENASRVGRHTYSVYRNGTTDSQGYTNGVAQTDTATQNVTSQAFQVNNIGGVSGYRANAWVKELLIYADDKRSVLAAFEAKVRAPYSI